MSAQKALLESETKTRESLEGTKESTSSSLIMVFYLKDKKAYRKYRVRRSDLENLIVFDPAPV